MIVLASPFFLVSLCPGKWRKRDSGTCNGFALLPWKQNSFKALKIPYISYKKTILMLNKATRKRKL